MDCGLNFATLRIRQQRRRQHQRAMAMWSHFWIAVRRRISASATSGEPFICPYRPSCWDGWPEAKSLSALFSSHPTITQRMAPNGRFYQSPPPEVEVRSSTRSSCVAVEAKSFPFYANPSFKTVAQSSAFKVRLHFLSISSKLLIGSAILFRRKYGRRFSVVFFSRPVWWMHRYLESAQNGAVVVWENGRTTSGDTIHRSHIFFLFLNTTLTSVIRMHRKSKILVKRKKNFHFLEGKKRRRMEQMALGTSLNTRQGVWGF